MPSPFPGMDPYLEAPDLWPEVHSRIIVALADALEEHLSQRYRFAIEKRVYISTAADSLLVGIPDVSVAAQTPRSKSSPSPKLTTASPSQPSRITLPLAEEIQERYLEIREVATGTVITTVEILSPKNKRPGEGRQAYLRKRNHILAGLTHLVEIDLLRVGEPMPLIGAAATDYRMLVSRSDLRPAADLYEFSVRQQIPALPIPLASGDSIPAISVQDILAQVYRRGRYRLAIDYTQPPQPPLTPEDAVWAKALSSHS